MCLTVGSSHQEQFSFARLLPSFFGISTCHPSAFFCHPQIYCAHNGFVKLLNSFFVLLIIVTSFKEVYVKVREGVSSPRDVQVLSAH
jgi:hypothetical protein